MQSHSLQGKELVKMLGNAVAELENLMEILVHDLGKAQDNTQAG